MSGTRMRVAILISGRGSNMMSLVDACRGDGSPVEVAAVISNRHDAAGIAWAREQGLATGIVNHRAYETRAAFEAALEAEILSHGADLIALAGFMRILEAPFVSRWEGRMLNIHPSLLPAFKGLHTHEQAIAAGVKIAGCTVHFVTPEMDAGPIIAQAAVPVCEGDTAATLAARILKAEHRIYPMALAMVASGAARLEEGRVMHKGPVNQTGVLFSPEPV
jgi:phosphoribosylglycinamide formyltransferase 1